MRFSFKLIRFLLKPLSALLRRITQTFSSPPDENDLDDSIISISANRMHF
jgi:hypothetical protein